MSVGSTVLDIASYTTAGLLAASKLLTATQAFWSKLPKWLAVALPVVVLDIPQVVAALTNVTTGTDLVTAAITSVALLLPGLEAAEKTA
jgi:hypothetical protein